MFIKCKSAGELDLIINLEKVIMISTCSQSSRIAEIALEGFETPISVYKNSIVTIDKSQIRTNVDLLKDIINL